MLDERGFFDFAGREFDLVCKHEDDSEGNKRERWGVPPANRPLSKDKLRELDRLLARDHEDGIDDGDVPF